MPEYATRIRIRTLLVLLTHSLLLPRVTASGKETVEDINTPLFLPNYIRGQRYFSYAFTGWLLGYIVLYVCDAHIKRGVLRTSLRKTGMCACTLPPYVALYFFSLPSSLLLTVRPLLCVPFSCGLSFNCRYADFGPEDHCFRPVRRWVLDKQEEFMTPSEAERAQLEQIERDIAKSKRV